MKRLLFVCTSNLDRSPCAEALFRNNKICEARSCGTMPHAETRITKEAITWADTIFCMEHEHKAFLYQSFPAAFDKELVVLNIPNTYARNDPGLENLLRIKLAKWLK